MERTSPALLALILALALATPAAASGYTVMTGPTAPFSITKGLHVNGISVDTIEVMMDMTDTPFSRKDVKLMPWKKAYGRTKALPNHIMLNVPRTPEVENDFKWVGPVYFPKYVLIGKKDREFDISSVADASKYKIGTVRGSEMTKELLKQGIDPSALKEASAQVQPLLQLKSGQVDLLASTDMAATHLMQKMGVNIKDYKVVYAYKKIALYFAFSKKTDNATIKLMNNALASYKTPMSEWSSVFDKNVRKYLPKGVVE